MQPVPIHVYHLCVIPIRGEMHSIQLYVINKRLIENTEGPIKNGHSRETGDIKFVGDV